jgi:hypothetical protein
MMALTRSKIARAAMNTSRIRIVRRVSILYHRNVIAAPRTAYSDICEVRFDKGNRRWRRTV